MYRCEYCGYLKSALVLEKVLMYCEKVCNIITCYPIKPDWCPRGNDNDQRRSN